MKEAVTVCIVVSPSAPVLSACSERNMGAEAVQLESPCTTLASVPTFRNGGLEGSGSGCRPSLTTVSIDAGATLDRSWEIRAVRRDGLPVDRGAYTAQVELLPAGLPSLEASFRVR